MNETQSSINRIKTGTFERKWALTKASLIAGTRLIGCSASALFGPKEQRDLAYKRGLAEQANYLVEEIGKLKGSVVKIGQMMALYGEHFLPDEVTAALHKLEDTTTAVEWPVIEAILMDELGDARMAELLIDPVPIGCASIGQVHRATRTSDGAQLCLKVQYPGVASAVDTDLNAVKTLLKLTRVVPITRELENWLDEIRHMMHREVNYELEAASTQLFGERLHNDRRFIVPRIFGDYCTAHVIAMSYEEGMSANSPDLLKLSQKERNDIGTALLDLCWREVFEWEEMQTDPNFGNYLIRVNHSRATPNQIVLLDFGAIRRFPEHTLAAGKKLIRGAYEDKTNIVVESLDQIAFFAPNTPNYVKESVAKLCRLALEPFLPVPSYTDCGNHIDHEGRYDWHRSQLMERLTRQASTQALSRFFNIPPAELMFLVRKIIGAYTFLSVIQSHTKGPDIIWPHIEKLVQKQKHG